MDRSSLIPFDLSDLAVLGLHPEAYDQKGKSSFKITSSKVLGSRNLRNKSNLFCNIEILNGFLLVRVGLVYPQASTV